MSSKKQYNSRIRYKIYCPILEIPECWDDPVELVFRPNIPGN